MKTDNIQIMAPQAVASSFISDTLALCAFSSVATNVNTSAGYSKLSIIRVGN